MAKFGLADLDRLKFDGLEQIKFALDTGRSRQRLAELATRFGGVRELFAQLELTRRREYEPAWFSSATSGSSSTASSRPRSRRCSSGRSTRIRRRRCSSRRSSPWRNSSTWLEACPRKGDMGYVPADYVDPPELEEVTEEAPRVDAPVSRASASRSARAASAAPSSA